MSGAKLLGWNNESEKMKEWKENQKRLAQFSLRAMKLMLWGKKITNIRKWPTRTTKHDWRASTYDVDGKVISQYHYASRQCLTGDESVSDRSGERGSAARFSHCKRYHYCFNRGESSFHSASKFPS